MEMIDVLKKLEEIATKSPEVSKAIEQVKQTNPTDVDTNAVESETAINQEPVKEYEDKIQEYSVSSYKDFLASKGLNIYKLKGDDHVKYAKMYKQEKDSAHQDATAKKGTDDHKTYTPSTADSPAKIEDETMEGALKQAMHDDAENMSKEEFVEKYGQGSEDFWHSINGYDEGNAFAQAVQKAKASGMKAGDKFKVGDEEHTLRDSDFEQINTNTMENKDKEVVSEAIKISTDSPEEAGMMMQILALAGVKPVDASMLGGDQEHDHDGMTHSHPGGDEEHSHDDMRSMMDKIPSGDDKAEEQYANTPDEKTQDTDELLNVQSGGLNKQKQQVRKEYPGDNPLAVEDKITEEELANSYKAQYEAFKTAYQTEAKKAKPDFLDMDKDGNKEEPMKKAIKDKEEKSK